MNNNNAWGQPDQPSTDPSAQRMRPMPREEQAWGTLSPNSPTTSTSAASPTGEDFDDPKSSGKGKRIVFLVIAVLAALALVGCQMRVFGTGVLGTRYCRVPGSWYRAEGCVGPDR